MTFSDILQNFGFVIPLDTVDPEWRPMVAANNAILERNLTTLPELIAAFPTERTIDQDAYCALVAARYYAFNDLEAATAELDRIEPVLDQLHPAVRALSRARQGVIQRTRRDWEQILALNIEAETIFRDLGWKALEAMFHFEVGMALNMLGDVAGACDAMLQGMDLVGDDLAPTMVAAMQANLAGALVHAGDYRRAAAMERDLLTKPPFVELSMERYRMLLNHSATLMYLNEIDAADAIYVLMLEIVTPDEHPVEFYRISISRADAALRKNDEAAAWSNLQHGAALLSLPEKYRQTQYWNEALTEYHAVHGQLLALQGNLEQGMEEYRRACEISIVIGSHEMRQRIMQEMLGVVTDPATRLSILEELTILQRERFDAAAAAVANTLKIRTRYQEEMARRDAERQREQMRAVIETQDRVQREIARDLHDSVGQDLSIVRMMLDRIAREQVAGQDAAVQMLTQATEQVLKVSSDVRRLSHLIAAVDIDGSGLARALDKLCAATHAAWSGVTVSFYTHGDFTDVPDDVARALYRCTQSILQNAMRHADPTRVDVQLLRHERDVILTIEDDGRGFDPSAVVKGLGLREILARAEAVGGTVHVDSAVGRGTNVEVRV